MTIGDELGRPRAAGQDTDPPQPLLYQFGTAILVTALAVLIRALLFPVLGSRAPFAIFFLVITYTAWQGSLGPAILSLLLSAAAAMALFVPPVTPEHSRIDDIWNLSIFLFTGTGMIFMGVSYRTAQRRALANAHQAIEREQSLTRVLERMTDGFVVLGRDWRYVYANDRAAQILGTTRQKLLGNNVWELFPQNVNTPGYYELQRSLRDQATVHYESWIEDARVWVEFHSYPTPEGLSIFFADVTARKQVEQQREELLKIERSARTDAERASRLKDEFLATVSHELRTPLNAILGWAQLLRTDDGNAEDLRQGLDTIERNARSQAQLVDDLLDMSRITSGRMRLEIGRVNLADVIDAAIESIRPAAAARDIQINRQITPPIPTIGGDGSRLQQVAWNLLSNAVKFTPRGGQVTVRLSADDKSVQFSVSDTGIGIKPDFMDHLFQRFRQADSSMTRRHGGLGLGLSICRHLVELHGGTLGAQSDGEGKGSAFTVEIPIAGALHAISVPPVEPSATGPDNSIDLSGVRVLIVDDEPDACELVKRWLSAVRAEVHAASSAAEAMNLIHDNPPHVLISDIGMPEEDGFAFLRRLRSLPANQGGAIPALALTAFARVEDRTRAMLSGFQAHLSKPVEAQELVANVASLAGRAPV